MFKVGVDCEKIARFKRLPYGKAGNFYRRIFTPHEIEYCVSSREPYHRFAVRFAAKEAAIKALAGITRPYYRDIEIRRARSGEPKIYIRGNNSGRAKDLNMALSLAHSKSHAIAFVIVTDSAKEKNGFKKSLKKIIPSEKKKFDR